MHCATTTIADPNSVEQAIETRFSCRAFSDKPVDNDTIKRILQTASRAPSGTNTQPWKVYVLQGKARDSLVEKVCDVYAQIAQNPELKKQYEEPYDYYPSEWVSPFIDRRRACGWGLYGTLGIEKGEREKMFHQQRRNFTYFDAPVGLVFTINKVMGRGSLLDYGMFLQSIMVAARAHGLHTCPQAAWNEFHSIVLPHVGAGEDEQIISSMALGYADPDAVVNTFTPEREAVDTFTRWLD